MISNGLDQSREEIMGVEISSILSFSLVVRNPSFKMKGMSLAKIVKGLPILLKSLMNLR